MFDNIQNSLAQSTTHHIEIFEGYRYSTANYSVTTGDLGVRELAIKRAGFVYFRHINCPDPIRHEPSGSLSYSKTSISFAPIAQS